jgi:protocatechuate 4,5-dioxygenase alpha chain
MMKGGRSVEGNRRLGEDGDAQAQNQPQTDPRQGD